MMVRFSPLAIKLLISIVLLVAVLVATFGVDAWHAYERNADLAALNDTNLSFQEYEDFFHDLATRKGGAYAYQALLDAPLAPGTDLHLLGHVIGDVLYQQEGIKGIEVCTPDFRNACSHSIVIGIFNDQGVAALDAIAEACRNAPGGSGAYTMCFHGLGHGILAYTGYNMEKAVELCKETGTPERQDREYAECVGGTMMEMVAGVNDQDAWELEKDNYFLPNDPLAPCNMSFITGEASTFCYAYLTPHLFEAAGGDLGNPDATVFEKAFTFCNAIPRDNPIDRNACYGGFGKEFVVLAQGRDVRDIGSMKAEALTQVRNWCALAHDEDGEEACNGNALASLFWGGENNPDASFLYCAIAEPGKSQDVCYAQIAQSISYFLRGDSAAQSLCRRLPEPHQDFCLANI